MGKYSKNIRAWSELYWYLHDFYLNIRSWLLSPMTSFALFILPPQLVSCCLNIYPWLPSPSMRISLPFAQIQICRRRQEELTKQWFIALFRQKHSCHSETPILSSSGSCQWGQPFASISPELEQVPTEYICRKLASYGTEWVLHIKFNSITKLTISLVYSQPLPTWTKKLRSIVSLDQATSPRKVCTPIQQIVYATNGYTLKRSFHLHSYLPIAAHAPNRIRSPSLTLHPSSTIQDLTQMRHSSPLSQNRTHMSSLTHCLCCSPRTKNKASICPQDQSFSLSLLAMPLSLHSSQITSTPHTHPTAKTLTSSQQFQTQ